MTPTQPLLVLPQIEHQLKMYAHHKGDLRNIPGVVVRPSGYTFYINGKDRRGLGKRLCQRVWDWAIFHAALMSCAGLWAHQIGFPHAI